MAARRTQTSTGSLGWSINLLIASVRMILFAQVAYLLSVITVERWRQGYSATPTVITEVAVPGEATLSRIATVASGS